MFFTVHYGPMAWADEDSERYMQRTTDRRKISMMY
jgi:hypothetical protein